MNDENVVTTKAEVEEYVEWLRFSAMDYDSAKYLYEAPMHPRPREVICYHCQQAAEKAVKALIVYFGAPGGMPKVHDIEFLLNQVKNLLKSDKGIDITQHIYDIADNLTRYGVAPRYPNEIEVEDYHVKAAFEQATEIIEWVKRAISADKV